MSLVDAARPGHKRRCWLFGALAIAALTGLWVWLSRPVVFVGRAFPAVELVACGDISHQAWNELLQRFVDTEGNVDYTGWKASAEDLRRLDEYLADLSRLDETQPATPSQQLAYWINAYNAVTVRGILREYPTTSIQNHMSRIWGYNIWRDLRLIVGDRHRSLGEIEHSILRTMKEPRIHFAIVCASRGCPPLLNEAYSADRLDEQLQRNAQAFFADPTKCRFDPSRNELHLSPILRWYAADFGRTRADMLCRIAEWLPDDIRAEIHSNRIRVTYLDYDWNLNDQTTAGPPLPPF
jgi:hypothetical protein